MTTVFSNRKGCKFNLVIIDNFPKRGQRLPLQNKHAQTITDFLKRNKTSKRKPNPFETDDGTEYTKNFFNEFMKLNNFKTKSRYTSAERFLWINLSKRYVID